MINKIKEGIEVSKNLLDTLPKNNIKNKTKYQTTLEETKNNYEELLGKLQKQIDNRYNTYTNINPDTNIDDQLQKINFIKHNLFLLNPYNSSYEKLELDKILYQLNHFYKADLNEANNNILECINIFKKVGIDLKAADFNYSDVAHEYIETLLTNPDNIKETFEKLYWQCPDLFIHIELNIKYLYYMNQNVFEKYITSEKTKFIEQLDKNALETYKELVINYEDNINESLYLGLTKFINRELNIADYEKIKMEKCYSFFTDEVETEHINEEIQKLSESVQEYQSYLYFNYIINDLKEKYKDKKDQKNGLKSIFKEIKKNEKLIYKYSKKKNKKDKINTKILTLIQELESLYDSLDEAVFNDRIYKYLNEDSSIYEALAIACSHYSYIVKCIKDNEKDVSFEEEQNKLIEFILNPYNNVISNIRISEEKDIALIISDKYKLSNFNITKEDLETEAKLEEIKSNAKKINVYNNIVSKISYDNIKFIVQAKDILKK